MTRPEPPEQAIRDLVAHADGRKRRRAAHARLAAWAPRAAGVLVLGAVGARLVHAPAWLVPVLAIVMSTALACAWWLVARPSRPGDRTAARVDAEAGLAGELRSAFWFVSEASPSREARPPWLQFHLNRAVAQVRTVDWSRVYPGVPLTRPLLVSGALACAALVLTLSWPAAAPTPRVVATQALADRLATMAGDPTLPPDLRDELARVLAVLQQQGLTPQELARLLAALDPSHPAPVLSEDALRTLLRNTLDARQRREAAATADARATAPVPPAPPAPDEASAAWAREERAAREASDAALRTEDVAGRDGARTEARGGESADEPGARQAASGSGAGAQARDTTSSTGTSQMMLGANLGTGDGPSGASVAGAGQASARGGSVALSAALRKEVIEAHRDVRGANVNSPEHRRQAEQAESALAFSRAAALQTFDRSQAAPPPPVPEGRRLMLEGYFTRR